MVKKKLQDMAKKMSRMGAAEKHSQMSLREEVSGKKKQTNSFQSIRKLQHLQNLAVWAASEASIPSLAALYGRRFAVTGDAMGLPPDSSVFPCQRCKTILQPGFNCTIRIVKNKAKKNKKRKFEDQRNNVVYNCHFCSHENVKRGTSKGHMKNICPPKQKQPSKPEPAHNKQATVNKLETEKTVEIVSPSTATKETSSVTGNFSAPSVVKCLTLLDSKKRKRNKPKPKKNDESEAKSAMAEASSAKRKRKGWTSLREIAEKNEKEKAKTFNNLSIPFTL